MDNSTKKGTKAWSVKELNVFHLEDLFVQSFQQAWLQKEFASVTHYYNTFTSLQRLRIPLQ